jgi:integrase
MQACLNDIALIGAGYNPRTLTPDQRRALADHWQVFPWANLRYAHTSAARAALAELYGAASANKHLAALRGVLKETWRLGQISAEEYQRAADLAGVPISKPDQAEVGRHLTMGELHALIHACVTEGTAAGARDAALIALGYACGLRRAELANLQVADFDGQALTLTGKRNKTRVVPVTDGARDALLDWLSLRASCVGGTGPLFVQIRKGNHVTAAGITAQAVYNILAARAAKAGVKESSPHDLRRTFAGDLLDAGADIVTVQKLMGHSNVATTAGYDRRGAQAKKAAVAKLHVPYQRRHALARS